jgi:hypothetical protein
MLVTNAIFLSFHSNDFLLPYSPQAQIPPRADPKPPFGDISNTAQMKIIPSSTNNIVNKVFITKKIR